MDPNQRVSESDMDTTAISVPSPHPMTIELPLPPLQTPKNHFWHRLPLMEQLQNTRTKPDENGKAAKSDAGQVNKLLDTAKKMTRIFVAGRFEASDTPAPVATNAPAPVAANVTFDVGHSNTAVSDTLDDTLQRGNLASRIMRGTIRRMTTRSSRRLEQAEQGGQTDEVAQPLETGSRKRSDTSSSKLSFTTSKKKFKASGPVTEPPAEPHPEPLSEPHSEPFPPRESELRKNAAIANYAKERALWMCVWTLSMGGVEAAHILPFSINSTSRNLSIFNDMTTELTKMFGANFINRIKILFGRGRGCSDQIWNLLVMTPHVHLLYDTGLIGFRPVEVITGLKDEVPYYKVFSQSTGLMREDYARNQRQYDLFNVITGRRLANGDVKSVEMDNLEDAQNMYDCLTLSWTMRVILFFAGGTGTPDGDITGDEYYRPEEDITGVDSDEEAAL